MLCAGEELTLAGVWSLRGTSAQRLAASRGVPRFGSFTELLEASDAVAFAVPPAVQAQLAPIAATRGKHLLLEKPLADTSAGARNIADAIERAQVGSLMMLTSRFTNSVSTLLNQVASMTPVGARVWSISSAALAGPFSHSRWRTELGTLYDAGPHALDLATAALGPVVELAARRSTGGWVSLHLTHQGGAVSDVSLALTAGRGTAGAEVHGPGETLTIDLNDPGGWGDVFGEAHREFARAIAERRHPLDVRHGLQLQLLIEAASTQLHR
jgi:predicted dehydrogenase